jgi:transcription elongation GreA/GreB family factor
MSRAFVKDDDDGPEPTFNRPVSDAPNYVTPQGLDQLKASLAEAEASQNEREIRYYNERIESAILIDPASRKRDTVQFGATVSAHDNRGRPLEVRIVGEDEADPVHGSISFESPVAKALLDHRAGDRVLVQRPAGPIQYTIDSVSYE